MSADSSLEAAVTQVLREHAWSDGFTSNCACQDEAVWTHKDHREHLAAAVIEALQLQPEWAIQQTPGRDASNVEYRTESTAREALADLGGWVPGSCIVRRFVGPWVAVDGSQR